MEEFFRQNYLILTYSTEILATLTGIICYKKYKFSNAKYFIWFLAYLVICEFLGGYTRFVRDDRFLNFLKGSLIEKNYWWSTLYWKVGAIMFFAFYYRKIIRTKSFNEILKYVSYSFFAFSMIYILWHWQEFFVSFFPILSVLGSIVVFLCSVFYFIEVLQSDNILTFYKSLNFYISAAIFIWWLIITPIVFYDNYTAYEVDVYVRDWDYIELRKLIYLSSNIFMYSTFTFALIFCKPQLKND